MKWPALVVAILTCAVSSPAQQQTLTTLYAHDNGQYGAMFDLFARDCVTIDSFNANLAAGTWDIAVYTKPGTLVGHESNATAWTLVGTTSGVVSNGPDTATPTGIPIGIAMTAGDIRAFYVTTTNAPGLLYTTGTTPGATVASDANLEVFEGAGVVFPFGFAFSPRAFNGDIIYTPATTCVAPFGVNHPVSSLDLDGVAGTPGAPAIVRGCLGAGHALNSTSTGGGWDIAYHLSPVLAAPPGITSPGGQPVNLDLSDPTLSTFNGGPGLSLAFLPHPGSFSVPINPPAPLTAAAQQVVTDPTHPDGLRLSQPCQLEIPLVTTVPLTLGDDDNIQVFAQGFPHCGTSFPFYGTVYTAFFVNSNGDVSMTAGHTNFAATSSDWVQNMPRIGLHSDLEPNIYGGISVTRTGQSSSGSEFTVAYTNVTEWGAGLGVTSYDVVLNGPAGHEIKNFTTDGTWGVTPTVMGISNGALGTPMANLVSFDAGFGLGPIPNPSSMDNVIAENTGGMIPNTTGWTNIQFPNGDGSSYLVQ